LRWTSPGPVLEWCGELGLQHLTVPELSTLMDHCYLKWVLIGSFHSFVLVSLIRWQWHQSLNLDYMAHAADQIAAAGPAAQPEVDSDHETMPHLFVDL